MSIGKAILYFRDRANLTMTQLSEKSGVSQSAISQYENDKKVPSEETLSKLASALNVPVFEILNKADDETLDKSYYEESRIQEGASRLQYPSEGLEYQIRRIKDRIYRNNDAVIELSSNVSLGIRARIYDIESELLNGIYKKRPSKFIPTDHPLQAIVGNVIEQVLYENREEIAYRVERELERINFNVKDLIETLRNRRHRDW